MARVLELFVGRDGVIRVAKAKTSERVLFRPLQRLYPLEMASDDALGLSANQSVDDSNNGYGGQDTDRHDEQSMSKRFVTKSGLI